MVHAQELPNHFVEESWSQEEKQIFEEIKRLYKDAYLAVEDKSTIEELRKIDKNEILTLENYVEEHAYIFKDKSDLKYLTSVIKSVRGVNEIKIKRVVSNAHIDSVLIVLEPKMESATTEEAIIASLDVQEGLIEYFSQNKEIYDWAFIVDSTRKKYYSLKREFRAKINELPTNPTRSRLVNFLDSIDNSMSYEQLSNADSVFAYRVVLDAIQEPFLREVEDATTLHLADKKFLCLKFDNIKDYIVKQQILLTTPHTANDTSIYITLPFKIIETRIDVERKKKNQENLIFETKATLVEEYGYQLNNWNVNKKVKGEERKLLRRLDCQQKKLIKMDNRKKYVLHTEELPIVVEFHRERTLPDTLGGNELFFWSIKSMKCPTMSPITSNRISDITFNLLHTYSFASLGDVKVHFTERVGKGIRSGWKFYWNMEKNDDSKAIISYFGIRDYYRTAEEVEGENAAQKKVWYTDNLRSIKEPFLEELRTKLNIKIEEK